MPYKPLKKLLFEWNKAYLILPRDHIVSHKYICEKPFLPSYENKCRPNMNYLLCWEYNRIWNNEKTEFLKKRRKNETIKTFKRPNFKTNEKKSEPKTLFKMKKFENIPSKTDHKGSEPRRNGNISENKNTKKIKGEEENIQTNESNNFEQVEPEIYVDCCN